MKNKRELRGTLLWKEERVSLCYKVRRLRPLVLLVGKVKFSRYRPEQALGDPVG